MRPLAAVRPGILQVVQIRRVGDSDVASVMAAAELFDDAPLEDATRRFLSSPTHHLFLAEDDSGAAIGFVSGVEVTHPDKGTEMFLYELAVADAHRRRGVGRSLVEALWRLAQERGGYGMFVGIEPDNEAARRTYLSAGAGAESPTAMLEWQAPSGDRHRL